MAIIRLDCNLNGGDSVTPNNELFYRIYGDVDNYAAPIHETGTALTDANVTVDNDKVIITGIDGTTNTTFKIAAVDGAFNEGILSDTHTTFIIGVPYSEDFSAITQPDANHEYDNVAGGPVWSITGQELVGAATDETEDLTSRYRTLLDIGFASLDDGDIVLSWDERVSAQNTNAPFSFGLYGEIDNLGNTSPTYSSFVLQSAGATVMKLRARANQVLLDQTQFTVDCTTTKTFKIVLNNTACILSLWNGASWDEVTNFTYPDPLEARIYGVEARISSNGTMDLFIDNINVRNQDFLTQYPL